MYLSIRDAMIMDAGFTSLAEGLNTIGLNAFELAVSHQMTAMRIDGGAAPDAVLGNDASVVAFKRSLASAGVRVSALLLVTDFGHADRDGEIAWVTRCAELARALGADSVRLDAVVGDPDAPRDNRLALFTNSVKRLISETESLGTQFGIENHGEEGNDPAFLQTIIDGVGSPRLGMTLDIGNFYWSGKPLREVHDIIRRFAPLTKHAHMKNIGYPAEARQKNREPGWRYGDCCCTLAEGDIDVAQVIADLRSVEYASDLCIENESLGRYDEAERQAILERDASYLKELL